MAVEAHHLHLFPLQLLNNRETMIAMEKNGDFYGAQTGFAAEMPTFDTFCPSCNSADALPAGEPPARKRPREFCFLGEDLTRQILQQQLEIDQFIAHHMEKVRRELWVRRLRYSRSILDAAQLSVLQSLKVKDEEMEKMGRLNSALAERVRSLCVENQIWRDLARTNEMTVNALRTNLEQVLTQVRIPSGDDPPAPGAAAEDAESYCDSNGQEKVPDSGESASARASPRCRNCWKGEACVLLLPCRHLCLCSDCGSTLHTCPICKSDKSGSVHVNLS